MWKGYNARTNKFQTVNRIQAQSGSAEFHASQLEEALQANQFHFEMKISFDESEADLEKLTESGGWLIDFPSISNNH